MIYTMMHGKLHRATITEANLNYMGSITIDADLLDAAGILPGERVQICNNNNGARIETYTIAGKRGSGVVCLNGAAAARLLPRLGDIVIIIAYTQMDEKEARSFTPRVVMLGEGNQPLKSRGTEKEREVAD